jgi:hypothetical protein
MTVIHTLQSLRSPEPGRPFVNREGELQFIEEKLRPGCQGDSMPMVVTCFWGAFGIGKSWLLGELERCYRRNGPQVHSPYPTLAARLDMNPLIVPSLWQDGKLDVARVVQELWRQLAWQMGTVAPDLGQPSAEEWAGAFVEQVTAWLAHATPVVMLDTMDIVVRDDEAAFFWLEEHLVERLALTDRVLFIFASRGELRRWRRFQVRRRVDSYPLSAFDADTAGKELKASPEVSRALYRHAFGHPLATEYLGRMLEEQGISLEMVEEGEVEGVLEPSLVQAVLNEVTKQILDKVPESLTQLARHANVLRWVNIEPLRYLAEALGLADPDRGDAYYLDLIGQLQAHHLLYWNVDTASYESDRALRRLLAYSLKLDDVKRFRAAHLAAYDYHRGHLERYPQYLARYVPEAAYHHAIVAQRAPLPREVPAFQAWWEEFLSEQTLRDSEPWSELFSALERDTELREMLPVEEYERLCSEARDRAAASATS